MPAPSCSEDRFIELFETYGASQTALTLGTNERSVYDRRKNIQSRTGVTITAPLHQIPEDTQKSTPPKILYYDIETTPMRAWTFRLGDQHIQHTQIVDGDKIDIICITYCWDKGPAYALDWDYKKQDSSKMIEAFDGIVSQADIVIGQNSDSFDAKHINTQRLMHGLPPFPDWADLTDDTLKQMRRFFKFPSNKLDYISKTFGFGGKVKMEMQDWIDIVEQNENGLTSFNRMIRYGKKDVIDTRKVLHKIKPHIKPRLNMAAFYGDVRCTNCGSHDIKKSRVKLSGSVKKQHFYCNTHNGYAGKATVLLNGTLGKMLT